MTIWTLYNWRNHSEYQAAGYGDRFNRCIAKPQKHWLVTVTYEENHEAATEREALELAMDSIRNHLTLMEAASYSVRRVVAPEDAPDNRYPVTKPYEGDA